MDDVDAVQAQIARNMLQSGDWVTARLDGMAYLEKSPLKYWMIAVSYKIFGVARLGGADSDRAVGGAAVLGDGAVRRVGVRAAGGNVRGPGAGDLRRAVPVHAHADSGRDADAGDRAGVVGLLRALDEGEAHPRRWALAMWAAMGAGLLLKGLIAAVFPMAARHCSIWRSRGSYGSRADVAAAAARVAGSLSVLAIAAPWHVLATLRNPPYLRFHDAQRARVLSWILLVLFHQRARAALPEPALSARLQHGAAALVLAVPPAVVVSVERVFSGGRSKLRLPQAGPRVARCGCWRLCWTGFILVFFTFSTTQEYYSMPCYPALALLLGSAIGERATRGCNTAHRRWRRWPTAAALAIGGDSVDGARRCRRRAISRRRLAQNPGCVHAFAGAHGGPDAAGPSPICGCRWRWRAWRSRSARRRRGGARAARAPWRGLAAMMVLFFHAARLALVVFDPYMSSRPLAEALLSAPPGKLIVDDQYYTFSSVFFYTNRRALLLNGRVNNLVYGSYAPDAPRTSSSTMQSSAVFGSHPSDITWWRKVPECLASKQSHKPGYLR